MKVLLVDDDNLRVERILSFFEGRNFSRENITVVTHTNAAKKICRQNYFDLLILDVVLPKKSDDKPLSQNGLEFLKKIASSASYKKPGKIIGITGYWEDIASFKIEFEELCFILLEARSEKGAWLEKLFNQVSYTNASLIGNVDAKKRIYVLTIHGIRTFGDWQLNFKKLIYSNSRSVCINSYKYGYFTVISFLIPPLRKVQVNALVRDLLFTFETNPNCQFFIYSHSFGTYLIAKALEKLISQGHYLPLKGLVLAGSVLDSKYDWTYLHRATTAKIVNDCGINDVILMLSKLLVLGTGMAGRVGFAGANDNLRVNRFFKGGHSHYFQDKSFMEKYWLPLISDIDNAHEIDHRTGDSDLSKSFHGTLNFLVTMFSLVKWLIYIAIIVVAILYM